MAQLPKAKDTKERIDQYWQGNGVDVKEDTELDYSPKYSEEYLGKVMAEIEELHKEDQSENESEDSSTVDSDTELAKSDDNYAIDEGPSNESKNNIVTIEEANADLIESYRESPVDGNRQIVDKNEQPSEATESKSQKKGFFGGLFGRKK